MSIQLFKPIFDGSQGRPLMLCPVMAGWPSPAEDYIEDKLNLHSYVVRNEPSTYFVKASGDSMTGAGIFDKDILVVDRSLNPAPGKVVIAVVEGEFTVKRFVRKKGRSFLVPENPAYCSLDVTTHEDFSIWGVVTHVVHSL